MLKVLSQCKNNTKVRNYRHFVMFYYHCPFGLSFGCGSTIIPWILRLDFHLKFESKKNSPTFVSIKIRYGEKFSYC